MKAKTTIYLLFLVGSVLLIAIWAWALATRVEPLGIALATAATAILCIASRLVATKKMREDRALSLDDIATAGRLIAIAPTAIGLGVLIWEYVPSKSGAGSHLERRYALLFFAIAVYMVVFPLLCRRHAR